MPSKLTKKGKAIRFKVCRCNDHFWQILKYWKHIPKLRKKSGAFLFCAKCSSKTIAVFDSSEDELLNDFRCRWKLWKKE